MLYECYGSLGSRGFHFAVGMPRLLLWLGGVWSWCLGYFRILLRCCGFRCGCFVIGFVVGGDLSVGWAGVLLFGV